MTNLIQLDRQRTLGSVGLAEVNLDQFRVV